MKLRISSNLNLVEGTVLFIKEEKNGIALYLGSTAVARFASKRGRLIAFCLADGLRYEATVMKDKLGFYAKLVRKT